jgi:enoyl-CoA hydratase/carnithine racemase
VTPLRITSHGDVVVVEMAAAGLTTATLAAFEAVVVRPRAGTRAIVLTGAGDFSRGADVGELGTLSPARLRRVLDRSHRLLARLDASRVPVVAAIGGRCLGGGLELALACHVRIAGESARLGMPEVTFGIVPGLGGMVGLPRLVGRGRATELLLTGRSIRAADAYAMGLVERVVPDIAVVDEALRLARRIASKSPAAVGAILRCIHATTAHRLHDARRLARASFIDLVARPAVARALAIAGSATTPARPTDRRTP